MQIAIRNGWLLAIVKGDSQILIHMAQQMANGKSAEKVASSWCLVGRMEDLRTLIVTYSVLYFHHIRREANRVVELMANIGVSNIRASWRGRLDEFKEEQWIPNCR